MNTAIARFIADLLLAALLTGCVATRAVDWNQRVGRYSYEQAVAELGPPDKLLTQADGGKVADWVTQRGVRPPVEPGWSGSTSYGSLREVRTGPGLGPATGSAHDRFLRLTFDAAGRLTDWRDDFR